MDSNTRCVSRFGDIGTGLVGAKHSSNKFSSSVRIRSRMLRPYTRNSSPSDQTKSANLKELGYGG
jgi:hypothetical protein